MSGIAIFGLVTLSVDLPATCDLGRRWVVGVCLRVIAASAFACLRPKSADSVTGVVCEATNG